MESINTTNNVKEEVHQKEIEKLVIAYYIACYIKFLN